MANRNHVHLYPCGILQQAYAQLVEEGVPLVKPQSELARRIEKQGQLSPLPRIFFNELARMLSPSEAVLKAAYLAEQGLRPAVLSR